MRHVLQMVVHLVLHIEDDALGNPRVDIALQYGDDLGSRQRDKGHYQQPDQQAHVLPDQRLIYDPPRDDAWQQTEDCRNKNRHKHQQKLRPVWEQVGEDPLHQRAVYDWHVFLFFIRQETARAKPASRRCHTTTPFPSIMHKYTLIVNRIHTHVKQKSMNFPAHRAIFVVFNG